MFEKITDKFVVNAKDKIIEEIDKAANSPRANISKGLLQLGVAGLIVIFCGNDKDSSEKKRKRDIPDHTVINNYYYSSKEEIDV